MFEVRDVTVVGFEQFVRRLTYITNKYEEYQDSGICKGGDSGIGCENCANSDGCSHVYDRSFQLGKHDLAIIQGMPRDMKLALLSMIVVYADVTATKDFWKKCINTMSCGETDILAVTYPYLLNKYDELKVLDLSEDERAFFNWICSLPYLKRMADTQ